MNKFSVELCVFSVVLRVFFPLQTDLFQNALMAR